MSRLYLTGFERCARQREINQRERTRTQQAIAECRRGDYSQLDFLEREFHPITGRTNPDNRWYRTSHEELRAWREAADAQAAASDEPPQCSDDADHPERE